MQFLTTVRRTLLFALAALCFCLPWCRGAEPGADDTWVESARFRLHQIYEGGVFRSPGLQPSWSSDGSQLRIRNRAAADGQAAWVWLQAVTGEETSPPEPPPSGGDHAQELSYSPDGTHRFVTDRGSLLVRSLQDPTGDPVVTVPGKEGLRFSGMTWSHNSRHLAFIQSDRSEVRTRAMLVPDDPSYPTVRELSFARVGETIETLKVGLIDIKTKTLAWVDLDPRSSDGQQGFYLGQVGMAGGMRSTTA